MGRKNVHCTPQHAIPKQFQVDTGSDAAGAVHEPNGSARGQSWREGRAATDVARKSPPRLCPAALYISLFLRFLVRFLAAPCLCFGEGAAEFPAPPCAGAPLCPVPLAFLRAHRGVCVRLQCFLQPTPDRPPSAGAIVIAILQLGVLCPTICDGCVRVSGVWCDACARSSAEQLTPLLGANLPAT